MGKQQELGIYIGSFFDELMRAGVRDVVISPGSRSTPLAMVAYEAHVRLGATFNIYVDVDERGAAFFALGLAKASSRAVALICTSGTAVANYYPAIMEAKTSRVPLLVLTGDRPLRLQQLGAPQTCDQLKVFSDAVRKFFQMPEPNAGERYIAHVRQVAREAVAAAAPGTHVSAPVHINFAFDEPLVPDCREEHLLSTGRIKDHELLPSIVRSEGELSHADAQILVSYLENHDFIVLAGEGTFSAAALHDHTRRDREAQALLAFSERFDAPLLADPLSQLRAYGHPGVICGYDSILAGDDIPPFDAVVRFGRYPVSKRVAQLIEAMRPPQIVVDPLESRDFNSQTTTLVVADPLDFVTAMLEAVSLDFDELPDESITLPTRVQEWGMLDRARAERLLHAEDAGVDTPAKDSITNDATDSDVSTDDVSDSDEPIDGEIDSDVSTDDETESDVSTDDAISNASTRNDRIEGAYVQALLEEIPAESLLFSGNSMSIRAVDSCYFTRGKRLTVLANRGLNGIDGTTSTALGAAQEFAQTVYLTGDLTFLHDLNALSLQSEMILREQDGSRRPSIVIVVLNNNGGAIFDMLPQQSDQAYFRRLFLTPQQVNFTCAADAFGIPAHTVTSVAGFRRACQKAWGVPGITLIEIPLPLEGVKDRYALYW